MKCNVVPLDDRGFERINPDIAGRPQLIRGNTQLLFQGGYSADEACDVGCDTGSPASPDYGPTGNRFTGEIEWVQLDIGEDSHDHRIDHQMRSAAMAARRFKAGRRGPRFTRCAARSAIAVASPRLRVPT